MATRPNLIGYVTAESADSALIFKSNINTYHEVSFNEIENEE